MLLLYNISADLSSFLAFSYYSEFGLTHTLNWLYTYLSYREKTSNNNNFITFSCFLFICL